MFNGENANKTFFTAVLGVGISLILSVVLIVSAAFVLSFTKDPRSLVLPTGLTVLYLSAFTGGTVGAKISEGILCPALSGLIMTALILLLSILYPDGGDMPPLVKTAAFLSVGLSSLLGGAAYFFAERKRGRKRKTNRRRK